ncbi:RimK family alpha-L-glutamate ligase [Patescibacteria group bacterium]
MSKKLLILVDKIGRKKELLTSYIARKMPKNEVFMARFSDLIFYTNGNQISVVIDDYKKRLTDFDLVYFRRVGSEFLSVAGTLAVYLDHAGIKYVDKIFSNLGPSGDKFTSLVRLATLGLPVIPSYFCWNTKVEARKKEIISRLGLPLVAKQLGSQRGRGVLLLRNEEEFNKLNIEFPNEEFLFQKYYPSDKEYRVLVLEDRIGSYERKIRTDKEEFRSNVALGAKEEFLDIDKIEPEVKKIAIDACKALNIQVGGVDILVDKNGKSWLLEVNRGPGLTYDSKVSPELSGLTKYLARKLNEN